MHYINSEKYDKLTSAFRASLSIRNAACYAGVSLNTAKRYFHMLPPMVCPCGRELPHRALCDYRIAISPARQAYLKSVTDGRINDLSLERWVVYREKIIHALNNTNFLCITDQAEFEGFKKLYQQPPDLKRFYNPPTQGVEWYNDKAQVICVQNATQEDSSIALYTALEKLHPSVRKFCLALIDGASIQEAADECGISRDELATVLPPLRVFLKPYLGLES